MTSATTRRARGTRGLGGEGYGLVLFAAVMLLVASFFNLIDGIDAAGGPYSTSAGTSRLTISAATHT